MSDPGGTVDPFSAFRESHVKRYRSTAAEVWGQENEAYCDGCNRAWPCEVAEILGLIDTQFNSYLEAYVAAANQPSLCPECGQMAFGVHIEGVPRWDEDRVRERLGFPVEGRCGNCGSHLGRANEVLEGRDDTPALRARLAEARAERDAHTGRAPRTVGPDCE